MPAEETGKHNFIRDERVTNFAELWTSLWILGCTGNSLIEIIKDVCVCGHVVRMLPSLIILCLGCSPILPIIIFSCHRSNVHWILKVPDLAYCLSCIYFIIFVFFALHQSQDTVLPLGWFFFQRPPSPQKFTMTPLTSRSFHQSKLFVLAPKLKSTNQNPDFKPPKVSWLKRHHYYWSRILLTMLFSPVFGDTGGGDIWKSQWRGESFLSFFCLITSFDILRRITHSKEMLNVQCHISADVFPRRNCSRIEADLRTTWGRRCVGSVTRVASKGNPTLMVHLVMATSEPAF